MLSADNTCCWNPNIASGQSNEVGVNVRTGFHTYAFEWLPDSVTWYIDGKVVRKRKVGMPPIPDLSAKIMMNLWIFNDGAYFGGPKLSNNRYPMTSEYDWFRFYRWDGDEAY